MPSFPTSSARNVSISKDDALELRLFASDCEAELLRHFEQATYQDNAKVDKKKWKLLKSRDGCAVYRARTQSGLSLGTGVFGSHSSRSGGGSDSSLGSGSQRARQMPLPLTLADDDGATPMMERWDSSGPSNGASSSDSGSSSQPAPDASMIEIGPIAAISASSSQPVLLLAGTLLGTLDDYMYAFYVQDTPTIRERNVYMANGIHQTSLMCNLEQATMEDPFQYLGFGWLKLPIPSMAGLIKPRDAVVLVDSRIAKTTKGERVGMWICHSIESDAMPPSDDGKTIRAKMSIATVFRQQDPEHLQVFQISFMDLLGKIAKPVAKQQINELLLAIPHLHDAIILRKLAWAMRHRVIPHDTSSTNEEDDNVCGSCGRELQPYAALRNCQLCLHTVCAKCRVEKMLVVETLGNAIVTKPFEFCTKCILTVKSTNGFDIALSEVDKVASQRGESSSSSSSRSVPASINALSA